MIPCLSSFLRSGSTISKSASGIRVCINSTMVTFVPSVAYTWPSSNPIAPPPITNIVSGISFNSNAVFDVSTDGWSIGTPGRPEETDPTAIIHFSKVTLIVSLAVLTINSVLELKAACPSNVLTFLALAIWSSPITNLLTVLSFCLRRAPKSIFGLPKTTPAFDSSFASFIIFETCNKALEGIQPRFKHTPPNVGSRSINKTLFPRSAKRNAAVYPPGPAPITTNSAFIFFAI